MSIFGKVLAILNILAAIAFVYLATQLRGTRHAWAYAAYRHELVLDGLPLDDAETDADNTPLVEKLTDSTASQLFQGNPTKTLEREVERRYNELKADIDQAGDDAAKRQKLEQVLLLTARTGGERDELRQKARDPKVAIDALLDDAFSAARNKGLNPEARRQAIAHVLIGVAEDPASFENTERNLKRVATAVGTRQYTKAMEGHALNLRDMGDRVRLASAVDRSDFMRLYELRVWQILELAGHIDDLKRHLQQLQEQVAENHGPLVTAREKDVADLKAELALVETARDAALAAQTKLEGTLFAIQRRLSEASAKNLQLERDIRNLEIGR